MNYLFISLVSILILFFLQSKYSSFILPKESIQENDRKIHSQEVSRFGGISILPLIFILNSVNDQNIINLLYFGLIIFLIGFVEDVMNGIPAIIRFILLSAIVTYFLLDSNFIIYDFNHLYLNTILTSSNFVLYLFFILGFLFMINGFNFIDGNNGLMLGFSLFVLITYSIVIYHQNDINSDLFILCCGTIVALSSLFIFNIFTGKILSGDSGSYFLGFIIGGVSILMAKYNFLNSLTVACIIFYPVMEIVFTFYRRLLILRVSPFKPDNKHLHMLLYQLLLKKFSNNKKTINFNLINSLTSLIILLIIASTYLFIFLVLRNTNEVIILIVLALFYIIAHISLEKSLKTTNS